MSQLEIAKQIIERKGYKLNPDDDGDYHFMYQMKEFILMAEISDDNEAYMSLLCPGIVKVEEGEEALLLTTCNKFNRTMKFVKAFIDQDMCYVSVLCGAYCTGEEDLENFIHYGLLKLGCSRSKFLAIRENLRS